MLNIIKLSILFAVAANLCAGQGIHISGVVADSAGAGIQGATVRLETAGLTTTSAADGSFSLVGEAQSVMRDLSAQRFDCRFSPSFNILSHVKPA